jgi:hypothetical protein
MLLQGVVLETVNCIELKCLIDEKMCRMSSQIHLAQSCPTAGDWASSLHHIWQ